VEGTIAEHQQAADEQACLPGDQLPQTSPGGGTRCMWKTTFTKRHVPKPVFLLAIMNRS
jgi:hypothetical protein